MADYYEKILENDVVKAYFLGSRKDPRSICVSFAFEKSNIERKAATNKKTFEDQWSEVNEGLIDTAEKIMKYVADETGTASVNVFTKTFEHCARSSKAINGPGGVEIDLWVEFKDGVPPVMGVKYDLDYGKVLRKKLNKVIEKEEIEDFIKNIKNKAIEIIDKCDAFK